MSDPLADLARLEGVPSAVMSARDAVDAVLRDRGLRVVTAEQSAEALLAGARASAALTDDPDRWLPGSVRLCTEIPSLGALVTTSPSQALARAHALAATGEVPDAQLGRLRPAPGVSERMIGLAALLTRPTTASGIVLAAVAHAEVASVSPFGSADGLVARALEHMVLIRTGVDARAVLAPALGHLALRAGFEEALAGYQEGTVPGVRAWLLHCARALTSTAEASHLPATRRPRT